MLFEVHKIVDDVLGPESDNHKYPREFIIDVLMEYVSQEASEQYLHLAFSPVSQYISILKLSTLIDRAKQMKENRSKSNRITAHDAITDATVIFDGIISGVGGYTLFVTPHSKLYDVLRDTPTKLIGRIFLETLSNGVDIQYLKIGSCIPAWIASKSQRQLLRNLEYHGVKFNRIQMSLVAAEEIQNYREKYGE